VGERNTSAVCAPGMLDRARSLIRVPGRTAWIRPTVDQDGEKASNPPMRCNDPVGW